MAETTICDLDLDETEAAEHPWPHIQAMFALQPKKNQKKTQLSWAVICLPKHVNISAYFISCGRCLMFSFIY